MENRQSQDMRNQKVNDAASQQGYLYAHYCVTGIGPEAMKESV